MNVRDARNYYEAAADVLSLPGTYNGVSSRDMDVAFHEDSGGVGENLAEAAAAIFTNTLGGNRDRVVVDTLFNAAK